MAAAARRLRISEASLRRRPAEEGTTYKQVVDAIRKELALSYVQERRQLSEISRCVGFSTLSAFGRAFRRWTGASPMQYKARLRE